MFGADVAQTLQLVQQTLEENESETLGFISKMTGQAPRGNMRKIRQHMYAVGNSLSRMYFNGILYHSEEYGKAHGKRNSTICTYFTEKERKFGQIQRFIADTEEHFAEVLEFEPHPRSLLQYTGHPCRPTLKVYSDIDICQNIFMP